MDQSSVALTVPSSLRAAAADSPDMEAVVDGDRRLTFAELQARVGEFARALVAAGVQPGEAVSIWAPNSATWVIASFGAHAVGAVLVPVNTRYKGTEARHLLTKARVVLLVVDQGFLGNDYLGMLRAAAADADAQGPLLARACRHCAGSSRSAQRTTPLLSGTKISWPPPSTLTRLRLTGGRMPSRRKRCATSCSRRARAAPPRA